MNTIYTNGVIASLEFGWGEGWLSPGGNEELERLLDGVEIRGKTILDIGVGTGGPALALNLTPVAIHHQLKIKDQINIRQSRTATEQLKLKHEYGRQCT